MPLNGFGIVYQDDLEWIAKCSDVQCRRCIFSDNGERANCDDKRKEWFLKDGPNYRIGAIVKFDIGMQGQAIVVGYKWYDETQTEYVCFCRDQRLRTLRASDIVEEIGFSKEMAEFLGIRS